jgi:serine/threonine protein kinase
VSNNNQVERLASEVALGARVDWLAEKTAALKPEASVIAALEAIHIATSAGGDQSGVTFPADVISGTPLGSWRHFTLLRLLGRGAFADVFLARDTRLDRNVALKLLRTPSRRMDAYFAEARMLARVRHPNVVPILGVDSDNGRIGLWMEYLDGVRLDAFILDRGRLTRQEFDEVASGLCDAVSAVHNAGVIHGDIKPSNIVIMRDGRPVLADFGAGVDRWRTSDDREDVIGTPLFAAPEILAGGRPSIESDVYSLGLVFHFMATGCLHGSRQARRHTARRRTVVQRCVEALLFRTGNAPAMILRRATSNSREHRYSSVRALANDLEVWRWREKVAVVGMAVVALAFAVVLGWPTTRSTTSPLLTHLDASARAVAAPLYQSDFDSVGRVLQIAIVHPLISTACVYRRSRLIAGAGEPRCPPLVEVAGGGWVKQRVVPSFTGDLIALRIRRR